MTDVSGRRAEDGIVVTARPAGRAADHWAQMLRSFGKEHGSRIARGRTFARSGRVKDLAFAPGQVTAEVDDDEMHELTLRVRVFSDAEWNRIKKLLLNRLLYIAQLMSGELPESFVASLAEAGIHLLPKREEIDGDCTCGDYLHPCAHMAAAHALVADALDGEPFLLLTLRGRTREQLLAELRQAWGDGEAIAVRMAAIDEDLPEAVDPFASPVPVTRMSFAVDTAFGADPTPSTGQPVAVGLLALGPPPGEADLLRALEPLYAAGARAAIALVESDPLQAGDATPRLALDLRRDEPAETPREDTPVAAAQKREKAAAPKRTPGETLTEVLINALSEVEYAKSQELADRIGASVLEVRQELIELEKLGIVYRTGQTRGTRWWLG